MCVVAIKILEHLLNGRLETTACLHLSVSIHSRLN